MALTWAEFRDHVRRAILNDATPDEETGEFRWSNDELQIFCHWALDQFAQHTAVASATSYEDATQTQYELPDNVFSAEGLAQTVQVWTQKGTDVTYLDPIYYTPGVDPYESGGGFWEYPANVINLSEAPGEGHTLHVRYFAYYNRPVADEDTIDVPRWAVTPLAYLIGVHALSSASLKTSIIRQWNTRKDSGTPVQNPLLEQQKHFQRMYDEMMLKHMPQDRTNYWRVRT